MVVPLTDVTYPLVGPFLKTHSIPVPASRKFVELPSSTEPIHSHMNRNSQLFQIPPRLPTLAARNPNTPTASNLKILDSGIMPPLCTPSYMQSSYDPDCWEQSTPQARDH
ncbi:hypothetical protein VTL71DRAFT_2315 [Oculimacula yallundae]|uniref:Uncharacterized protein n=1 Tax=Oculimacula yallundae TaxID=86028 RepID=A0ABR4CAJ0_9HELO